MASHTHEAWPSPTVVWPMLHFVHLDLPVAFVNQPSLQSKHLVSPTMLYLPGVQSPEQSLEFMPRTSPNLPSGHARQLSNVVAPFALLQRPAGHVEHASLSPAPIEGLYRPIGQGSQSSASFAGLPVALSLATLSVRWPLPYLPIGQ